MNQINWEHVEQWRDALESGEYKQGKEYLKDVDDNFCCLGVACKIAKVSGYLDNHRWIYGRHATSLPAKAQNFLGVDNEFPSIFGKGFHHLNDILGFTFEEIAGLLTIALIERDGIE